MNNRPATIEEWDAEIKKQSLHLKFANQLEEMLQAHTRKIPLVQQALSDILRFPDAKRKEIYESLVLTGEIEVLADGIYELPQETKDIIDAELQHELNFYQTKWERLGNICNLISKEQELRTEKLVVRKPKGTTYYIDFDNGHDVNNDGSTPVKSNGDGPWATLDKFCENARVAGDKAIVRRGMIQAVTSDLTFTSSGAIANPILLEADYDDDWGDFVDLSATGTATLTFGSKTVTFSADISGVLAGGDWIYADGDDAREFAYEVANVSTVTVTLYLPYKGGQAGSGKTMYNMQAAPIWNIAAGNFEVMFDADSYWKLQGLHLRGTDGNGVIELDRCHGHIFKDLIVEGNGAADPGIKNTDDRAVFKCYKCRFYNYFEAISGTPGMGSPLCWFYDCFFATGTEAIVLRHWMTVYAYDCEFSNHATGDIFFDFGVAKAPWFFARNCKFLSATEMKDVNDQPFNIGYSEDHDQAVGDNRQLTGFSTAEATPIVQSETTKVRAGGGATSIKVTPSDKLATTWEMSRVLLFEYPIYAVKDVAKTYTVYFSSDDDTDWNADPLATELWIEAEYWGHAVNVARRILKSTGVCNNFDADDTVWDTLTVTVTPLQTGVLYLRGYYCKTKEAAKSNIFYCDTKIGIA